MDSLGISQPAVSKHLRVLREAGVVSCRAAAQRRLYSVDPGHKELDAWLAPYRRLWERHLDALERHLDNREEPGPTSPTEPTATAGRSSSSAGSRTRPSGSGRR